MNLNIFTTKELRSIYAMANDKAHEELRKNHNKKTDKYFYYVNLHKKAYNEVIKRNFAE